jgi:hypothetical protein
MTIREFFRILKAPPASLLKIPKNAKSIIPVSNFATIWTAKTTPTKVRKAMISIYFGDQET